MTDLRTLLTNEDKKMMFDYVTEYATDGDSNHADMDTLLRCWNSAKSEYLYKLLGNQFIIKKTLVYNKPISKLETELSEKFNRRGSACFNFHRVFDRFLWENRVTLGTDYYKLQLLMDLHYLISTSYEDEEFSVNTPDGHVIKVQKGCRPMRIISKLSKAYGGLDGMEEFQNEVSIILTQKKLTGEMTLSIHPMDYMTMSHNDSDWTSCMDWTDKGCYCRGTVEMMNSPMVIVAYLSSDNDMSFYAGGNRYTWNNKKWRELFIVDKDIITGVKGYPYQNSDLVKLVNSWLKELAEQNLGWTYEKDNVEYSHCSYTNVKHANGELSSIRIQFDTDTMYNDFGTIEHYGIFGTDAYDNIHLNYSGEEMCLMCGSTNCYFDSEGCLMCTDCDEPYYCACCGERINEDDRYELDGEYFCYSCYCDRAVRDPLTDEEHDTNNMTVLYLLKDNQDPKDVDWAWESSIEVYSMYGRHWNKYFNGEVKQYSSGWRSKYYVVPSMFKDLEDMSNLFGVSLEDYLPDDDEDNEN